MVTIVSFIGFLHGRCQIVTRPVLSYLVHPNLWYYKNPLHLGRNLWQIGYETIPNEALPLQASYGCLSWVIGGEITARYRECTVVANYIHIEIQCSAIKLYDITNNNPPNFQNRQTEIVPIFIQSAHYIREISTAFALCRVCVINFTYIHQDYTDTGVFLL